MTPSRSQTSQPHLSRPLSLPLLLLLLALGTACTPGLPSPRTGLTVVVEASRQESLERLRAARKLLRRADVQDARMAEFSTRPWARTEARELAALASASSPTQVADFLKAGAEHGQHLFALEASRLSPEDSETLAALFHCDDREPNARARCVQSAYERDSQALLALDLQQLQATPEPGAWVAALQDDLLPTIKHRGRTLRRALTFPAFPFVYAWRKNHSAHEYEGPQWIDFAQARIFTPTGGDFGAGREARLLQRYAPVLVQEVDPLARYDASVDRIGSVGLTLAGDDLRPMVDTDHPASYAYTDTLTLHGQEVLQLVYTFWYPEHPKLKRGIDLEAGAVEGLTLRLTLDAADRPMLYETLYNCGCSHRVFVDRRLEEAARVQWGKPEGDRPYAVQRSVEGKINWILPELVDFVPDQRPQLFVRAGFHMPATVRFAGSSDTFPTSPREAYTVLPYDMLEDLPYPTGEDSRTTDSRRSRRASLFTDTGVVRGAARLEGILLTPLGLYRAGQPRQRGTQLIHFDQADFDDPAIYDTYLRLPEEFFTESPATVSALHRDGDDSEAVATVGEQR